MPRSACVVGVGGLGCPASLALARAGVRALTLVDPDVVEASNLARQPWHHPADVGRPKVQSAGEKLARLFPRLSLSLRQARVVAADVEALFAAHDLVIDATDGVGTKFLLSDAAVLTGTPLVYGGALRFDGLAMRIERGGPCLRCLFETPPDDGPTCAQAGVLGAMVGLVGALEARLGLSPNAQPGVGTLHVIDGWALSFRSVRVRRRADCAACGEGRKPVLSDAVDPSCPTPPSTSPASSVP